MDCASVVCPEMKDKYENISLSSRTVVRRTEIINEELTQQLRDASKVFACYSLALDESTDIQDTAVTYFSYVEWMRISLKPKNCCH